MMPSPASPERSANNPSPITTTPAALKNSGACLPRVNEAEPKDRSISIGKVPRANANMIKSPETKDPLLSAENCIDCVSPTRCPPRRRNMNDQCCRFWIPNPVVITGFDFKSVLPRIQIGVGH